MKRILIVDDEVQVLDSLRRSFHGEFEGWEIEYVTSGAEALDQLDASSFDVIVSDMHMPQMDGATLLRKVQIGHPSVARIMITGDTEDEASLKAIPVAHQFLTKPCVPSDIINVVQRTCDLNDVLHNDKIFRLIGDIDTLPSLPRIYDELTQSLADPYIPMSAIAKIVQQDVGMCAKILQIVNSAYFSLRRHVTSIQTAITYIGANMIRNLVLSVEIFRVFKGDKTLPNFSLDSEQQHAYLTADIARKLMGSSPFSEDAFAAGMLHDVGKLILAWKLPAEYRAILEQSEHDARPVCEIEREMLGASHAEIGASLLGLWGLPYTIVEAVASHHHPEPTLRCRLDVVAAVHIANAMAHAPGTNPKQSGFLLNLEVDANYLKSKAICARITECLDAA